MLVDRWTGANGHERVGVRLMEVEEWHGREGVMVG